MANNNKKTILYIEDDSNCRLLLKKILEQNNFKVFEADDGLSGIEIAIKERIDLILLDITMTGMNGYEIATRIKSIDKCKKIPLVALTANVITNTKNMALISGCDGYLKKPINTVLIIKQINEFLGGKKEQIEPEKFPELMREYNIHLVSHLENEVIKLKRANNDLEQIDKLKSDFISLASHELRTPLVTIIGYIGLILTKRLGNISEEYEKILRIVERNARRLEKIVKDMFTISLIENKIPFIEVKKIDLEKTIEKILEDLALTLEERELTANFKHESNIPQVECDEEKITQVITNIIRNSIKFTENGGEIEIKLSYPSKKVLEKYGLEPKNFIEIVVDDTGIGIPPDKINKIFEKFIELADIEKHHTSEDEFMGGGIGLGLSVSHGIVQQHNGYLWAENKEESHGARFIIILPLKINSDYSEKKE